MGRLIPQLIVHAVVQTGLVTRVLADLALGQCSKREDGSLQPSLVYRSQEIRLIFVRIDTPQQLDRAYTVVHVSATCTACAQAKKSVWACGPQLGRISCACQHDADRQQKQHERQICQRVQAAAWDRTPC